MTHFSPFSRREILSLGGKGKNSNVRLSSNNVMYLEAGVNFMYSYAFSNYTVDRLQSIMPCSIVIPFKNLAA